MMLLPTTSWSLVLAAAKTSDPRAQAAMSRLCETYWFPLYAYLRRKGHSIEESEDLIQGFFARFLEKHYLQSVAPARGKFRSFLLASLQHFISNERDFRRAQKRGGHTPAISLDLTDAEDRLRFEPSDVLTPEKVYERDWALAVLDRVLANLREEWKRSAKEHHFDVLRGFLSSNDRAQHRDAATKLGMNEGAVRVAVHRLRKRYREALHEELANTVDDTSEIASELRFLFDALSKDLVSGRSTR